MQIYFSRKALPFVMLAFFSAPLFAQTYSNKPSSVFSFTVGLTSTKLLKDDKGYKSGILFNGGVAYSVMLSGRFNVAAELLYTGKAFKSEDPVVKYRNYFLDIPLYAQLKLGENIRINAGAQYSVGTNSQVVGLSSTNTSGVDVQHVKPVKATDYGFLLGAEFDISKSIAIGARYTVSGSAFFEQHALNFGVFQFCIIYSPIKTYRVFFGSKDEK